MNWMAFPWGAGAREEGTLRFGLWTLPRRRSVISRLPRHDRRAYHFDRSLRRARSAWTAWEDFMSTSQTIAQYLTDRGVPFTIHRHPRTMTAAETARVAHVPEEAIAKAVALRDDEGVFLAVLPAARNILLGELWRETHRPAHLATEAEIAELFPDCDLGAVPPFGEAYGLETIVDGHLFDEPVVYCEGGDHETLLELAGADFARLMESARLGAFAQQRQAES